MIQPIRVSRRAVDERAKLLNIPRKEAALQVTIDLCCELIDKAQTVDDLKPVLQLLVNRKLMTVA